MASKGIKQKRKENTSLILLNPAVEKEKSDSRERVSNFSLDFSAFGSSVLVGPRSKVALRGKGYAWASVLGSFNKLRKVGVFSYLI